MPTPWPKPRPWMTKVAAPAGPASASAAAAIARARTALQPTRLRAVDRLVEALDRVLGHDQVVRLRVEEQREHPPRAVARPPEEVLPVELLVGDHAECVVPVPR